MLLGIGVGLFDTDAEFSGAGFGLAAVAAVVTALVDRIGRVLNRRALPFLEDLRYQIPDALGPTASSGLAAIVVGFVGRVISRRLRLPSMVVVWRGSLRCCRG